MAQTANLLASNALQAKPIATTVNSSSTIRLIPGSLPFALAQSKKRPQSLPLQRASQLPEATKTWQRSLMSMLPQGVAHFSPYSLGTAILDLVLMTLLFSVDWLRVVPRLSPTIYLSYLMLFFFIAIHERVYDGALKGFRRERVTITKVVVWTTAIAALGLSSTYLMFSLLPILLWSSLNVAVLCAWRWLWQLLASGGHAAPARNILVVGAVATSQRVIHALTTTKDFAVGRLEFLPEHHLREPYGAVMLQRLARKNCVDELIVTTHDAGIAQTAIRHAQDCNLDVLFAPDLFGAKAQAVDFNGGVPLIKIHEQQLPAWGLALKRVIDVLLASSGLVLLFPCLFLMSVAVKLDSPGPVFYRAVRIGWKGKRFHCCKFRTMYTGADAAKEKLRFRNQRDRAFFKIENDPRITRIGRFLRRYSLDELPQLWNVLIGDMGLVGPRPHPPDDVERYGVGDLRRLDFVPGITGLWQITARRDPSFKRCVELDVDYITRWNLLLDLRILWRTIATVFQGSGV